MTSKTFPIVGAHFRPPAKGILSCLPAGQRLWLRAEPENPYDPNAVQVLVFSMDLKPDLESFFDEACQGAGFSGEEIFAQAEWHLGYIPKELAATLEITDDLPGILGFSGEPKKPYTVTFDPDPED